MSSGTKSSAFFEQKVAEILAQLQGESSSEARALEGEARKLEAVFLAWTPTTSFDERRQAVQKLFELQRNAIALLPPKSKP